jgi:hypothetical protein
MDFLSNYFDLTYLGLTAGVLGVALPVLWVTSYLLRCVGLWLKGQPMPTDRVLPNAVLGGILGVLMGLAIQPAWDMGQACVNYHEPLGSCMMSMLQSI